MNGNLTLFADDLNLFSMILQYLKDPEGFHVPTTFEVASGMSKGR